jgi:transcriptional regulator of nitric oxide reductase
MFAKVMTLWTAAKGWRTLGVSLVLAVVGVLQTADWATIVGPGAIGPVMLGVGAVVAALRALTDTPLGTK